MANKGRLLVALRVTLQLPNSALLGNVSEAAGSLVYADTLGLDGAGGCFCLTSSVPAWSGWRASGAEARAAKELIDSADALAALVADAAHEEAVAAMSGEPVASTAAMASALPSAPRTHHLLGALVSAPLEGCALLACGHTLIPPMHGDVYAFEKGMVLRHKRFGAVHLLFDPSNPSGSSDDASNDTAAAATAIKQVTLLDPPSMHAALRDEASPPMLLAVAVDAEALPALLGGAGAMLNASTASTTPSSSPSPSPSIVQLVLAVAAPIARRTLVRAVIPTWRRAWASAKIPYSASDHVDTNENTHPVALPQVSHGEIEMALSPPWPTAKVCSGIAKRAVAEQSPSESREHAADAPHPTATIAALVLAGLPGSGVSAAAAAVVATTSSTTRWLHVSAEGWADNGAGGADVTVLRAALSAALASFKDPMDGGAGEKPVRLLVEATSLAPLQTLLLTIDAAFVSLVAHGLPMPHIAAVVTCVDAPRALELEDADGNGRASPSLLDQCTAGFAQAILISETDSVSESKLRYLSSLLSAANPMATTTRTPYGARAAASTLASIISNATTTAAAATATATTIATTAAIATATTEATDADSDVALFDAPGQALARALIAPHWRKAQPKHSGATAAGLYTFTLPPPPNLDMHKLVPALRSWICGKSGVESAPGLTDTQGELLLLEGVVSASASPGAAASAVSLSLSRDAFWPPKEAAAAAQLALVAVGRGDGVRASLARLLLACRDLPELVAPAVASDDDRAAVMKALDEAPLPEGWHYTGTAYINDEGEKSAEHPLLSSALAASVATRNAEIDARNAEAARTLAAAEASAAEYLSKLQLS